MSNIFYVSDTHFGHANILHFLNSDNTKVRPFASVEEMDEILCRNWNAIVSPKDKVYHLGDVAFNMPALHRLKGLNGKKVLIKGNHDIYKLKDYSQYFYDVRSCISDKKMGIIFSHIPIHDSQLEFRFKYNVHGHTHGTVVPDIRYYNICVEHTNWAPIPLVEIGARIEHRNTKFDLNSGVYTEKELMIQLTKYHYLNRV